MIKHILKIIWTERKANAWILLELTLVFCVLWFCTDYLYFNVKRYMEPRGFDIEHTYRIGIDMKDEGRQTVASGTDEEKDAMLQDLWTIYDRIKKYPAIENVSYSIAATPYSGSNKTYGFFVDSTQVWSWVKVITPEFFNVFKINITSGSSFNDENSVAGNNIIISGDRNNMFGPEKVNEVKEIHNSDSTKNNVIGATNKVKVDEYTDYHLFMYYPLKKDDKSIIDWREIAIRVKPEADRDFADQFTKDMRNQLEVGHYFLSSVTSFEKDREGYMNWIGYSGNFKSIYSIATFLIVNIFLGIIGTFWFRTQSLRSEIGLRIATGASRANIQKMFVGETLLLLFLASVVAAVVCINVSLADILKDINVPIVYSKQDIEIRYFINYGLTFLFLAFIAILAVWYPAKQASEIPPAEALRDE